MATPTARVGICQLRPRCTAAESLDRLLALMQAHGAAAATADRCHLLVFCEMFLHGYATPLAELRRTAWRPDVSEPAVAAICAAAKTNAIGVIVGYAERPSEAEDTAIAAASNGETRVYNSALFVSDSGDILTNYRKTHLWEAPERLVFVAGDAPPPVVDFGPLRVGLMICYDVEFPEMVRSCRLRGAHLVVAPCALTVSGAAIATRMVPIRAKENNCFVAYVNEVADDDGVHAYCGRSVLAGPEGEPLALCAAFGAADATQAPPAAVEVSIAEIVWKVPTQGDFLRDRRPELYGL